MPTGIFKHKKGYKIKDTSKYKGQNTLGKRWKVKDTSNYTGQNGFQKGNKLRLNIKHTENTREKMRKPKSEAARRNMRKSKSEEHKKNMRKPKSKEHAQKIREANLGEKCIFWKGGISYEPYSVDWTTTLRRSIRERDNYICQLCNQYGNIVHHKDYDKKNCDPDNLITLCKSCHSKTNYSRKYWKLKIIDKIFNGKKK